MNRVTPKNHLKSFIDAPRAIKRQLTCPIEFTSGSSMIGRNGILVIPRNHLEGFVIRVFTVDDYAKDGAQEKI